MESEQYENATSGEKALGCLREPSHEESTQRWVESFVGLQSPYAGARKVNVTSRSMSIELVVGQLGETQRTALTTTRGNQASIYITEVIDSTSAELQSLHTPYISPAAVPSVTQLGRIMKGVLSPVAGKGWW